MISQSNNTKTRTCTDCGQAYTHEPMMLGATDMAADVTTCPTCSDIAEREAERATRKRKAKAAWEQSVPAEYRKTDITHADYRKHINAHALAQKWIKGENIGQDERRLFLGIIGESGQCKTRIISQVVKWIIWEGGHVLWLNSSRFQWACQNQFNDTHGKEASKWLREYQRARNLVFDDIGSLKSTEAVSDSLYALLEHRTANQLPMLWTSNETIGEMLAGKGISEKARKRNISRLAGFTNTLEI